MIFEHLTLERDDFKDFLRSKKFDVIDIPIVDDYFSVGASKETGYIISANGSLDRVIGFVFSGLKKSQSATLVLHTDHIFAITQNVLPFYNEDDKVTVTFIFKDNKVCVMIKNLLHLVVDETDDIKLLITGLDLCFKKTLKFDKILKMINVKTKEFFENTHQLPYTEENIEIVKKSVNTQYNLNAIKRYEQSINKAYDQVKVAQYMNDHYVGVMLSSVINSGKSLSLLVNEPTVDMSRKPSHDGKFLGHERITFPTKDLQKTEKLLDQLLVNEWSKHTLQMVNALILYQSAINGTTIKHFSVVMPKLYESKKNLSSFELFSLVSESDTYFDNRQSFKITFGLNVHIQVKDGTVIFYDEKFSTLNEAYVHFINYFKKRIMKKIPNSFINDDTFKLLAMINI